ncbi:MAG: peptidylprolyl isomerase [Planctomycetes bacterium]|nr:peptidylprolyl isomerase [Planctomycetota bacterium]MBI3844371.1 peptidylprolyl isomerase [Planctomycetota bacterium]
MPTSPKVAMGKVVTIHYTLSNSAGEVLDTSQGGEPFEYLHGGGNIVPGLESKLEGQAIGAHLAVVVEPADGYGVHDPKGVRHVTRGAFPPDVELQVGMQFRAENSEGEATPIWVTEVSGDDVTIDFNHPLAGETLHFDVTITEIRDASREEMEHGHPHGEGHHHHDH